MEQGNRMNNHGGGKPPKMPRFNMSWLYVIILISLIVVFLNGGGDALGGSANKKLLTLNSRNTSKRDTY